jgi:hypothetical protein
MSKKKKASKVRPDESPSVPRRRPGISKAAAAALAAVLLTGGVAATRLAPVRRAVGLAPLAAAPAPPQSGELSLSKEYIYAGGRLVATEEPQPSGPAPTGLLATAVSATATAASVEVSWSPPASCAGCAYVVERRGAGGATTTVTLQGHTATSVTDAGAEPDRAYLYSVRAVYPGGGGSVQSEPDLATTVVFTDGNPLQPGVPIRARHLTELRRAVNAVRDLAGGLGPASYTHADPVSDPPEQRRGIYLEDLTQLRERLDDALGPLGLQTPYPAEPLLARDAPVRAAHFEQLRERVR